MVETIKNQLRRINDHRANGQPMPLQDKVRQYVQDHPNCKVIDIAKALPEYDDSGVRRAIRKMVVSHQIVQRFNVN